MIMDYEKKYNELAGKMKKAYLYAQTDSTKAVLEDIMPELKESNDEKVRKELIDAIQGLWDNDALPMPLSVKRKDAWLDWLKKQSEQQETLCDKCRKAQPSHSCQDITALGRCYLELEKQGEQKPVEWSEDDEQYLLVCKNALEKYEVSDKWDSTIIMQWLKEKLKRPVKPNFRERYKCIANSEWFKKTHEGMSVSEENVEPKFKVKYAGSEYNVIEIKEIAGDAYYGIEDEPNHIDYVLPDNCEIISEQKPTQSEDEISIAIKDSKAYRIGFADGEAYAKEEMQSSEDSHE